MDRLQNHPANGGHFQGELGGRGLSIVSERIGRVDNDLRNIGVWDQLIYKPNTMHKDK